MTPDSQIESEGNMIDRRAGARPEVASYSKTEFIPLRDRSVPCPLSPAQESLWFIDQLNPGVPVYNEVEAVRLKGKLDVVTLEKAFNVVIARHEILRSIIQVVNEKPVAIAHKTWLLRI